MHYKVNDPMDTLALLYLRGQTTVNKAPSLKALAAKYLELDYKELEALGPDKYLERYEEL